MGSNFRRWLALVAGFAGTAADFASAQPFLAVPRLPCELATGRSRALLPRAAGFELLGPGAPRWGALVTTGPSGTDVRGEAAAAAVDLGVVRTQLSVSRWGVTFYREMRAGLSASAGGESGLGVLVDARAVRIAGYHDVSGVGAGWFVFGGAGPCKASFSVWPEVVSGAGALFPRAWELNVGVVSTQGALVGDASALGDAPPGVGFRALWRGRRWSFGARLDAASGAITLGAGLGGPLVGVSTIAWSGALGPRTSFGLMGGAS
jgi:hypothetical protein